MDGTNEITDILISKRRQEMSQTRKREARSTAANAGFKDGRGPGAKDLRGLQALENARKPSPPKLSEERQCPQTPSV